MFHLGTKMKKKKILYHSSEIRMREEIMQIETNDARNYIDL